MCKTLRVSKSGYYNWLKSGPSKRWMENQVISTHIKEIFEKSFESYGSPRIKVELENRGYYVSRPKVARIMKANYLVARKHRKFRFTTDSNHKYPIAPNILNQNFEVHRMGQVWVSDMTYIQTEEGWVYLTIILDLFNRKVVGWALSDNLSTEDTNWFTNDTLKQKGWETIKNNFDTSLCQIIALLKTKTDAFLEETYFDTDFKDDYPYRFLIEGMLHHNLYHLGQLGLVVKFLKEIKA